MGCTQSNINNHVDGVQNPYKRVIQQNVHRSPQFDRQSNMNHTQQINVTSSSQNHNQEIFYKSNQVTNNKFNSNKKQKQNGFTNNVDLQNAYEYLQQIYNKCQGNLDKYFNQLQQKLSEIYLTRSKQTLEKMNQNILINNQSKVQISQQILWFNLNILKVICRKTQYKFNPSIFKQINKLQKNLVGYLKTKYPRQSQNFVPGDLMSIFKEFDLTQDTQYDILKNSNTYFGSIDQINISIQIKKFINKLIDQLDTNYPKFQKLMQQNVFVINQNQDNQSKIDKTKKESVSNINNYIPAKKTLNYKIGRKIPQNVTKYKNFQTNKLEINSPQIFRTLIKWIEYLQDILLQPNQNLNKKRNFKCFIQYEYQNIQNQINQNQKNNEKKKDHKENQKDTIKKKQKQKNDKFNKQNPKIIFDEINEDQHYNLINFELIQKIQKEKNDYNSFNESLLSDMDRFNSHLLKLLDISTRKQKYVPLKEMQIIKYSNLNAKFISWVLSQKLILAIKKFVSIGKSFYNTQSMVTLDLIQFKVSDMMRCMVSGNKKQILAVYENMKRLQQIGQIKIIKIKNRLTTSLNDIMIIFAMKNTFLICQLQMILTDSTQKINQKYKNIQVLNHYFYELQRSPYGILSQIALLLAYKDSKVSYQDNITFQENKIKLDKCQLDHKQSIIEFKYQVKPFICSKCTKFYFKFQNIFLMKFCKSCNLFICGQCIFNENKDVEQTIVNKEIILKIQESVNNTLTKLRNISSVTGSSGVYRIFSQPFKKLCDIFGPKKMQISKLIDFLQIRAKNNLDNIPFYILNFSKGHVVFKSFKYRAQWKQIQNPFNQKQTFNDKDYLQYTNHDLILFLQPQLQKVLIKKKQDELLYLFISQEQVMQKFEKYQKGQDKQVQLGCLKVGDFKLIIEINLKRKNNEVNKNNVQEQIANKNYVNGQQVEIKTFKYDSIHQIISQLPDLSGARSILKLSDLGIRSQHMIFFKQINWSLNIKQLKLSKNNIIDVSVILERCTSLQRLYLNQNFIYAVKFQKQLPFLDILNCSKNRISLIDGFDKIKNTSKLLLDDNLIKEFPECILLNGKIINLSQNSLLDLGNIFKSKLPNIQQLYLDTNKYNGADKKSDILGQSVIIQFKKLKSLSLNYYFSTITINTQKLQRLNLSKNSLNNINLAGISNLKFIKITQNLLKNINFLFPIKNNSQNNIITEIYLNQNQIEELPIMKSISLIKLNIQNNRIYSIQNLKISSLPNLEQLSFVSNIIKRVCRLNLPKLKKLDLTSNSQIQDFQQLKQCKLPNLQYLCFSYINMPMKFPQLNLESLKQLQMKSMNFSQIQNLTKCNLPSLERLSLLQCIIQQFPILQFNTLKKFQLNQSHIQKLSNLQKCQFNNLTYLDLSFIKTENINIQLNDLQLAQKINLKSVFACNFNFPKLKQLILNGASIKNISGLQNSKLQQLQLLSIQRCEFIKQPSYNMSNLKTFIANQCKITEITDLFNSSLIKLQKIFLSKNSIKVIKINKNQLSNLRLIDLSHNQLQEFIQNIQLNNLQELFLNTNKLKKFPKIKAEKLKKLQIAQNQFQCILQLQNCRMPSLQNLQIQNYNLNLIIFPKFKFQSVRSLYLRGNKISNISNLQFCDLPIIEDINLTNNQIKQVPKLKFQKLKYLRINENKLNSIQNLSQSYLPELKILELETNQLTKLPYLPFANLRQIFMHQNQVVDIAQFNKSPIKTLQILNICGSRNLQNFPMILSNDLVQLYANSTKLCNIIRVNQYKNLIKLQLNSNGITYLPILNQKNLQMIQFQHNQIQNIDQFAQGQYLFVTEFSMTGNKLKTVPKLTMPKLQKAYLNQNQIENIDQFINSYLPQISVLTFDNNKIKSIPKLPYPLLSQLYFSQNCVQDVNFLNLPQYPNLRLIAAANNQVKKVQKFPKMNSLQKIWLNNSKLQDLNWLIQSAQNLKSLTFFAAPNNLIKQLPSLKQLNLSSIYLNDNPIQKIDKFLTDAQPIINKIYTFRLSIKQDNQQKYIQIQNQLYRISGGIINLSKYFQPSNWAK